MKKTTYRVLPFLFTFFLAFTVFTGCSKNDNKSLTKIRLNEVTRSAFYAPFYVAVQEGFFKEQGIEIDLTTGQGADTTTPNTQVENFLFSHVFLQLPKNMEEYPLISEFPVLVPTSQLW